MYKHFTFIFISSVVFFMLLIGSINYIIDPFSKNNTFINMFNTEKAVRDERIRKFQLLVMNPDTSSFIFGSSRSLRLDPILLGNLTHTKALNLGFTNGFVDEYYLYIKYLIETREVTNILIGIDLFSYSKGYVSDGVFPTELQKYFNLDHNYKATKYISFQMLKSSIKTLKYNLSHQGKPTDQYTKEGMRSFNPYKSIKDNQQAVDSYIKNNVVHGYVHWNTRSNFLDKSKLNKLLEITELCKKNNINVYLFMSPLYINQIRTKENRFQLQKELLHYIAKNISPVWDYNSITKINLDPSAYDDPFHYTFKTADSILTEVLTGTPAIKEYKGTYITADNVDDYLADID